MKSEDLIGKYMESDLWENPYHKKEYMEEYYPVKPVEPPPDVVDPTQWEKDRKTWVDLKGRIITDPFTLTGLRKWSYDDYDQNYVYGGYDVAGQDAYRFIRKVMDKATNPYGGYLYRRHQYLGYVGTMGILIPRGFRVAEEDDFRAQTGALMSSESYFIKKDFIDLCVELNLVKPEYERTAWWEPGGGSRANYRYIAKHWNERYVVLVSDYADYPNYELDDVVKALISDLWLVRIKQNVQVNYTKLQSNKTYNPKKLKKWWMDMFGADPNTDIFLTKTESVFNITNIESPRTILSLSFLISEMLLLFEYWKQYKSMIPYPVFPNFGFKGTMPQALIDANIMAIVEVFDEFFNTRHLATQKQKWASKIESGTDPLLTYINGGSDPPPSGGGGDDPIDVWAGKVGE